MPVRSPWQRPVATEPGCLRRRDYLRVQQWLSPVEVVQAAVLKSVEGQVLGFGSNADGGQVSVISGVADAGPPAGEPPYAGRHLLPGHVPGHGGPVLCAAAVLLGAAGEH
jgi:hypothetical protein